MEKIQKFFRFIMVVLAVAVAASCSKNAVDPQGPQTVQQQPVKAVNKDSVNTVGLDPVMGSVATNGKFSAAATATTGQCDGYSNSDKASWPTDHLNGNSVFKLFTGGKVIGGKNPVREVLPVVPKEQQTLSSGLFFDAFDCSKIATFGSLVWTAAGDKLVAGYFLDKTTSVSYTLIKGRDYTYNYDFVKVECLQQTNIDGVVIPNTVSKFSIKYEVIASGTVVNPPVVDPPVVTPGDPTQVIRNKDPYVQTSSTQFLLNEGAMVLGSNGFVLNDTPADDQPTRDDAYTRVRVSFRERFGPMLGLGNIGNVGYGSAYELLGFVAFKANVQNVLGNLPTFIGEKSNPDGTKSVGWVKLPANNYGDIYEYKINDLTFRLYVSAGKVGFKKGPSVYPADHRLVSLAQWKGSTAGNDPGVNGYGQTAIVIPFD